MSDLQETNIPTNLDRWTTQGLDGHLAAIGEGTGWSGRTSKNPSACLRLKILPATLPSGLRPRSTCARRRLPLIRSRGGEVDRQVRAGMYGDLSALIDIVIALPPPGPDVIRVLASRG